MKIRYLLMVCLLWMKSCHVKSIEEGDNDTEPNNEELFKRPTITPDPRFDPTLSNWISDSVMDFAHNLAIALDKGNAPNTQIFSPLSVMSALSILQMGSYGNTYKQLSKIFQNLIADNQMQSSKIHEEFGWLLEDVMLNRKNPRRPRNDSEWRNTIARANPTFGGAKTPDDHTIRVANAIFVDDSFKLRSDYNDAANSIYKSEVVTLNFKNDLQYAKHIINSWVNQNTLGKIPSILEDELERDTNMILASTLYFKGYWEQPFLDSGTAKANFYPDGRSGEPVKVLMMATGGVFPYYDALEYGCRIIGLPYKGNQTTMYIIQPYESTRTNLNELHKNLSGLKINEMISKMERKTAVLAFPKFHVTNSFQLKGALMKMGIEDIFKRDLSNLALITDTDQQYVPQVAAANSFNSFAPVQASPMIFSPTPSQVLVERAKVQVPSLYQGAVDRYNESPLIFSRFGETTNDTVQLPSSDQILWTQQGDLITGKVIPKQRQKRAVTYKVESEFMRGNLPLRLKDLILSKRITKSNPGKKLTRNRRQTTPSAALQNLDQLRSTPGLRRPQLYADEIIHKIDFNINEHGTEAAAATLAYLRRSGTDVAFRCDTPFLIIIRHDQTKLPLFYGLINVPL